MIAGARRRSSARRTVDRDGVVEVRHSNGDRGGRILLALAAVILVIGAGVKIRARFAAAPAGSEAGAATATAAAPARARGNDSPPRAPVPVVAAPRPAAPSGGPEADSAAQGAEGASPPAEVPDPAAAAPAAYEGIAAFPAPGTKRIKTGIVVPDDYPLPPGYVRHYQVTDKGQMLPAILMFHPDHPPVGPDGRPVDVPEDRVVPPDRVPPGLPVQMLDVPADAYADREAEGAEAP